MNLSEELQNLGLSEKESKVYMSVLELGQATVQEIAKKAEINRPIAYVVLDSLAKKGLCSVTEKNKKTYYASESPENLQLFFSLQKRELEEKQDRLNAIAGELKTIYEVQGGEHQFVKFYEGKKGLLATRNQMYAKPNDTVRIIYPLEDFQKFYSDAERKAGHEDRNRKKIYAKVLYTSQNEIVPTDASREMLLISSDNYPLAADISLFGDSKVRITSLNGKLSGVLIDDPEIYTTFVSIFELARLGVQSLNKPEKS